MFSSNYSSQEVRRVTAESKISSFASVRPSSTIESNLIDVSDVDNYFDVGCYRGVANDIEADYFPSQKRAIPVTNFCRSCYGQRRGAGKSNVCRLDRTKKSMYKRHMAARAFTKMLFASEPSDYTCCSECLDRLEYDSEGEKPQCPCQDDSSCDSSVVDTVLDGCDTSRWMVGALTFDATTHGDFRESYLKKGTHLYTIYPQEDKVKIGKSETVYTTYWMPQTGYCSKMVILFHNLVTKQEILYEGQDLMKSIWSLISPNLKYEDDDFESVIRGEGHIVCLSNSYCKLLGLPKEDETIPYSMAMKQWKDHGVPVAKDGSEGVVFSKVGDVLHVGYRCRYEWSADYDETVIIDNGVNQFVPIKELHPWVHSYRNRWSPLEKGAVKPAELIVYMKYKAISFNLYIQNVVNGDIIAVSSNVGFGKNALCQILFDNVKKVYTKHTPALESTRANSVAPSEDKKDPEPEEPAVVCENPNDHKKNYYAVLRAPWAKSFRFRGKRWYRNGGRIYCKQDSEFALPPSNLDEYIFHGVLYAVVDSHRCGDAEVLTLVLHERMEWNMSDNNWMHVNVDVIPAPSAKHDYALTEWCDMDGKCAMIENDFPLAFKKARAFISTTTKGAYVPMRWLETSLMIYAQQERNLRHRTKNTSKGHWFDAWRANIWDSLYEKWESSLARSIRANWWIWMFFVTCLFLLAYMGILSLSWWFMCTFIYGSFFWPFTFLVYFGTVIESVYIVFKIIKMTFSHMKMSFGGLVVGRAVSQGTSLRQELSLDKLSDLYVANEWSSFSLSGLKCFWKGTQIPFRKLLSKMERVKTAPLKHESVANCVDVENEKFMHKIAPASKVGSLWAFLVRACSPVAIPEIESRHMLKGFEGTQTLICDIQRGIKLNELHDFEVYLAQTLRRKRAAYRSGYEKFLNRPFIPSTMDIVVKPDEKQHHTGVYGDLFSASYKPRNIFNPSEQVKGVGGWIMWNLMKVVKKDSILSDNFAAGKSPNELEDIMTKYYHKIPNPVFVSWDGHRHDSLQHAWFLEDVDNEILRACVPMVCAKLGLNHSQTTAILENLTALSVKVRAMGRHRGVSAKHSVNLLMEAMVFGTVFSGHPSRTTFGNTIRILVLVMFACVILGLKWNVDIYQAQAGDDTAIIIDSTKVEAFEACIKDLYKKYGLVMTDFCVGDEFEFVSRRGFVEKGRVRLMRIPGRVAQTGLHSTKVSGDAMNAMEANIIAQLKSAGSNVEGYSQSIYYRSSRLAYVGYSEKELYQASQVMLDNFNILDLFEEIDPVDNVAEDFKIMAACGGDVNYMIRKDC